MKGMCLGVIYKGKWFLMAVNAFFFSSLFSLSVLVCVTVIVSGRLLLRHFKYYESNLATLSRVYNLNYAGIFVRYGSNGNVEYGNVFL